MKKCIWCLRSNSDTAIEHIIPEALGCPENFIFNDGTVCQSCNNKLGHLDRAVIQDFDIVAFEYGIKRKGNKPPLVTSRGNFTAGYSPKEKYYVINMDKKAVTDPLGYTVVPYNGGERHIKAKLTLNSGMANVNFDVEFAKSKKFRRGIYKIALSSLAYFLGRDITLDNTFNDVRSFVNKGKGDRTILLKTTKDKTYKNQVWPPYVDKHGYYSIVIRLAAVEIVADLSPDQSMAPLLKEMSEKIYGDDGWSYMPLNT